jgi:glycerol-3-phosphate acyltransferase PlsY
MMAPALILAAYLLGSIPFAVVVSRAFGLPDPRSFGSRNPGATNVLRAGNRLAALITLVGDASKGAVAVLLCRWLAPALDLAPSLAAWAGLAAFVGHLFPVFLGFRGGKGVATFLGTLLALAPILGIFTCLLWLGMAVFFRYSSLASIVSATCAAFALLRIATEPGVAPAVAAMAGFVLWRHRRNFVNLVTGTETRIGQRSAGQKNAAAPQRTGDEQGGL